MIRDVPRFPVVAALAGFSCLVPSASAVAPTSAPIAVKQGSLHTSSATFAVEQEVQCRTFGRLLIVHVPRLGETTAQFWTADGTHVFFYLEHSRRETNIMCGAATSFGGH